MLDFQTGIFIEKIIFNQSLKMVRFVDVKDLNLIISFGMIIRYRI